MRRNLDEQLNKMFRLIYGKKIINEQEKEPVPNTANYVSTSVDDFFKTLESVDLPLIEQRKGSMTYKKDVETIQIGLILLGYQLPRFGVDGYFGPETAAAVEKFKSDNNIKDDVINENRIVEAKLMSPINYSRISSPFGQKRSYETHPGVDLAVPSGTPIKSPADGKVIDARFKEGACGGTIQVEHGDGFISRYCHAKEINVQTGQTVKQGDILGLTGGGSNDKGKGNSQGPHLHFELKKNGALVDPMDYIDKEIGSYEVSSNSLTKTNKSTVTEPMLDVLIKKLKEKNIKPEDILPYTNMKVLTGGGSMFTDIDLNDEEGYQLYEKICDEYIKTRSHNLLKITGKMLADGALMVYKKYDKYVPPELALSQLAMEGGFSGNPNDRPIKTKNPFNVGNVDSGENVYHSTVQSGINTYYDLIARNYMVKGKTATDLIKNFVNKNNNRYASTEYESLLKSILPSIKRKSDSIVANYDWNKSTDV